MAKFFGAVGYCRTVETKPGVYAPETIEIMYRGDVNRKTYRWENTEHINDDLSMNIEISIMADEYAYINCSDIKYVKYMGSKWKVTSITPESPRLILSIGGKYNG